MLHLYLSFEKLTYKFRKKQIEPYVRTTSTGFFRFLQQTFIIIYIIYIHTFTRYSSNRDLLLVVDIIDISFKFEVALNKN